MQKKLIFLVLICFTMIMFSGAVSAASVPAANFTANTTSGAAPLNVQFKDTSTNNATSWSWDFGDGSTSSDKNPSHNYTAVGSYNVTLNATNSTGTLSIARPNYIKVYNVPNSNFTISTGWGTGSSAAPLTYNAVQFTDNSTSNPTAWYWDFGDGTSSTQQNSTHTYTKAGSYTASLKVTNPAGSNTSAVQIQVYDTPLNVTTSLMGGTYNNTQTVILRSNDPTATIYYANDTTDPRTSSTGVMYTGPITISNTTTLRYAAIALGGYWSPLYLQNYVIGNGGLANSSQPEFQNNNNHTGQSSYTGPQTCNLQWVYTMGKGAYGMGSPAIGPDGTIYVGSNDGNLYAIKPDGSYKWIYATGATLWSTPAIGSDGTIYVSVGNTKMGALNFFAINPDGTPKWNCTVPSVYGSYGSPAIGADGTIYVGFNDGGQAVNNFYAFNPADGTVKWSAKVGSLEYSSPAIGSDGTIYIGDEKGYLYAVNPDGTIKWNYKVGNGASIRSAPAIGADGTIYIVGALTAALNPDGTLKWTYPVGSWSSPAIGADGTIYIGASNGLYAITSNGTLKWTYNGTSMSMYYNSATIGADGTIYIGSTNGNIYALKPDGTLKWNYTTGNSTYNTPAIGPDGTLYFAGIDKNVYAITNVVVNFTASVTNGTTPLVVQFNATSNDSTVSGWNWDFGDGNTSTEQNPTHTYTTAPGTRSVYNVKLTIKTDSGNKTQLRLNYITVYALPIVSFTENVTSGTQPLLVQFKDTSVGYNITSWLWDFGDGKTSEQQNSSHTYRNPGNYTVKLTVTNPGGSSSSTYDHITVNAPAVPVADFTVDNAWGINSSTVHFNDTSIGYNITSWLWDFGDGNTSTEENPVHTYSAVGNYTVSLTATNANGSNTNVKTGYILIRDGQSESLSSNNGVNIYVSNDGGVKYDMPDGVTTAAQFGGVYPYVPQTYYIAKGGGGQNPIQLSTDPYVIPGLTVINGTSATSFTNTTNMNGTFYVVFRGGIQHLDDAILLLAVNGTIADDFSVTITSSGYTYTLPAPGTSNPTVASLADITYVTNALNETFYKNDFLYQQNWRPYNQADYPIYNGENVTDPNNQFHLMFIDLNVGAFCSGQIPNEINNGAITVTYTFHNLESFAAFAVYGWFSACNWGTGIPQSSYNAICGYNVLGTPKPVSDFTANATIGNNSLDVQFTDNSTNNPTSWSWDFGDGSTSTLQNPTHTYAKAGNYTVKLTAANANAGNTETKTGYITVLDTIAPTASASVKSGLYNTNKSVTLSMSEAGTIYYTTDGSTPTRASNVYTGAIIVSSSTALKFLAVDGAGNASPVYTVKYAIDKTAPKISSTTPKNGDIYVTRTGTIPVKFSESIKASVNWSKVYVKNLRTGKKISISKLIKGNMLYIKTSKRSAYTWYQVYIPASAVKDSAGNNLVAKCTWKFKTGRY